VLDWEQKTDNAGHYVSTYARIKVLREAGKTWSIVQIDPYNPQMAAQPIIEARTIQPDGSVVPLQGKTEEILKFKDIAPNYREANFTMPGVQVGSILEYRWTIPLAAGKLNFVVGDPEKPLYSSLMAKSTPVWIAQQPVPVYKASFYFNPFTLLEANNKQILNNTLGFTGLVDGERATNLLYTERLPSGVHVSKSPKNEYFLTLNDVPPLSDEVSAAPPQSRMYQVEFYYSPFSFSDVYWENEIKKWSKSIGHATETTTAIKQFAELATSGAATAEEKAARLYDAVQALRNSDFTPQAVVIPEELNQTSAPPRTAKEVLETRGGTGNDLAILYLALAKSVGLDARAMKVTSRDRGIFDANLLSLSQLDSLLVALRLDGKDILLDPGQKFCPFGQLSWKHTLAGGIAEGAKSPAFTPPNNAKDAITAHTADLTVGPDGSITGTVKVLMNGPAALRWRQLNLTAGSAEVQSQITNALRRSLPPSINAEFASVQGLDTTAGFVAASFRVSGNIGPTTGKRLLLPAFFFSGAAHAEFASTDKRESAIDLHFADQIIDDVMVHLPPGYIVESAPQPAQLPWPQHAVLVVKTQTGPGTIDIKHIFARGFVILDPREYPELRDYYAKIAANDQQQLVLSSPGSGAGN
jgi:hypothetical protein